MPLHVVVAGYLAKVGADHSSAGWRVRFPAKELESSFPLLDPQEPVMVVWCDTNEVHNVGV